MSQIQLKLPSEAITLLKKVQKKHNISLEELQKEVITKYQTIKFFQADTTKSQEEKLIFCTKTVKGAYDNLIAYNPYDVVPTGIGPILVTKAGIKRANIHVWTRENDNVDAIRSISATDKQVDELRQIQLFNFYKEVKLGRYSSGDFSTDYRSVFQNPTPVNMQPLLIFEKLKIKRIKIVDVLSNIAKKEGKYDKTTDCRIIRGIIINHGKGTKVTDSGTEKEWAYYDIYDASFDEDFTDPDGVVVKTILRVWVHPMWMIYEKDNQIDFIGPITVYNKGVSMAAYTLLPVYTPSGNIEEA